MVSSGLNFMFQWYSALMKDTVTPSSHAVIRSLITMFTAPISMDRPELVPAAPLLAFSPLM